METDDRGFITDGMTDVTPEGTPAANKGPDTTDSKQSIVAEGRKWKAQLAGDLKTNEILDQYEDITSLAKAHLDLLDGKSTEFAVPDEDDAEAWNDLFGKLGRPETPKDYQTDMDLPDEANDSLRQVAHEIGLTQKQFGKFAEIVGQASNTQKEIDAILYKGTSKECEQSLKAEFGTNYDAKINYMKRGVELALPKDLRNVLSKLGHLNNPAIAKAFIAVGELAADDIPKGSNSSSKSKSGGLEDLYPDD